MICYKLVGVVRDRMLCVGMERTVFSVCLFERNQELTQQLILESALRVQQLGVPGETRETLQTLLNLSARSVEHANAVFLVLLSIDTELKAMIVDGKKALRLSGISKSKAERFFSYLDRDVILPWLYNEERTISDLVGVARETFLVS